ncbi:phosphatidyl inositol kinase [Clydaea vesicula]|uniref:Phosphatidylinositol 4-kinase n=1 Tax=Clydaea vesicula TaxID=447962 RepID=A0AAD5U6U0_9FUNG|nr:phosphatidyl inositol kinase [Clydaea vesicula]KAJ3381747.1 phosphatidyl inositol kinase [Lobulomyces angularis]
MSKLNHLLNKKKSSNKYSKLNSCDSSDNDNLNLLHEYENDISQHNSKESLDSLENDTQMSHCPSIQDLREVDQNIKNVNDSLVKPLNKDYVNPIPPVTPVSTQQFLNIIAEVRLAISEGIYPVRISQGSSGSYFCKDRQGNIVGVFKPKNEEPYGHLNPKAAASYIDRRLQLNVCPRTEIVSLASPSFHYPLKDRKAYRNGVPLPTKIGSFQLFLTGYKDATTFFKEGYEQVLSRSDSSSAIETTPSLTTSLSYNNPANPINWNEETRKEFQMGFERLVVLDYIIRNTDRGSDNWMVRYNGNNQVSVESSTLEVSQVIMTRDNDNKDTVLNISSYETSINVKTESFTESKLTLPSDLANIINHSNSKKSSSPIFSHVTTPASPSNSNNQIPNAQQGLSVEEINENRSDFAVKPVSISVSAIDNGLAFPYKHPDRWRSYPYGWAFLPIARCRFSSSTREQVLHLLTSQEWWRETLEGLERLFRIDPDFSVSMFKKQKAILRGQGYNLVEVLRRSEMDDVGGSPLGLLQRPVVAVFDEEDEDEDGIDGLKNKFKRFSQRFETFNREQPCFSWC